MHRSPLLSAFVPVVLSAVLCGQLSAQTANPPKPKVAKPTPYSAEVLKDEPVAYWRLDKPAKVGFLNEVGKSEADANLADVSLNAIIVGKPELLRSGPRPKSYPAFEDLNFGVQFGSAKSYLRVTDPGENSPFDFKKGDEITLEAWVAPDEITNGQQVYIVGKGRTQRAGFAAENQNYALRLRSEGGTARISFLFRNEKTAGSAGYHRWNSDLGFIPSDGWHHVALTYKFGDGKSIKGYLDGQPTDGTWDIGGPTDLGPVVDNDELWIGTSMSGNAASTFRGVIDEVAIYRKVLSAERMKARFHALPREPEIVDAELPDGKVLVQIFEGIPNKKSWKFNLPRAIESYTQPGLAYVEVPKKYNARGIHIDRTSPFVVRTMGMIDLPAGGHRLLLRSRDAARLYIDGRLVTQNPFFNISGTAHGYMRNVAKVTSPGIRKLQTGDTEVLVDFESPGKQHRFRLEFFVGGGKRRQEVGETAVFIEQESGAFRVLGRDLKTELTDEGWLALESDLRAGIAKLNSERRRVSGKQEDDYWKQRHELARQVIADQASADAPTEKPIDHFIAKEARDLFKPTAPIDDWAFLRRVTMDVIGIPPSPRMIKQFFDSQSKGSRQQYIQQLLKHPRWADNWMGYWQDVLAENPNIINPTLNNTGPFRWWIHESFLDNKPFDRFATELIRMEGSVYYGGPAGFAVASQNDVPFAAKAHIIGQAFLGVQMQCARCHDAPFHDIGQRDLFALAAMLNRNPQGVPKSSTVPLGSLTDGADSLVKVSIKPGEKIDPEWPFDEFVKWDAIKTPKAVKDSREQLAALITSPHNSRFAQVTVNRLWKRYLGRGIVEPVDDWEHAKPSHPELLDFLAREFIRSGYDVKHIAQLILTSDVYQRSTVAAPPRADEPYFDFAGPLRRRLTAEQVVDSVFAACGKDFNAGVMNIDADGARNFDTSLNLGMPTRAWQFLSLSNERDRPSLALPLAQDFVSTLQSFDWRGSRQNPRTERDNSPSVFQSASLANGVLGRRFTRMSEDSAFTELACNNGEVGQLIEIAFQRVLTRQPTADERAVFVELLTPGFEKRARDVDAKDVRITRPQTTGVSWSNHLSPDANQAQIALGRLVEVGDPPTIRLEQDWRERMEDMLWSLLNSPEFTYLP